MICKRVRCVEPTRFVVVLTIGLTAAISARAMESAPVAAVRPVTDVYFGTSVVDSYRWLENPADPEVKSWAAAQTRITEAYLDATPTYAHFKSRIAELNQTPPWRNRVFVRGTRLIYLRHTPPNPQAELVVLDHLGAAERVLFDPATVAVNGVQPAILSLFVAPDGRTVAFTTAVGGTEDEALHLVDVESGKMLADTLPHVGGGLSPVALAWDADGKGFVHTRWPKNADGSYAKQGILLFHHSLGTDPSADRYVFGKGRSPKSAYRTRFRTEGGQHSGVVPDIVPTAWWTLSLIQRNAVRHAGLASDMGR